VKDRRIGIRYAQALLGLAEQAGELEVIHSGLAKARRLIEKVPEISCLLMNTTIAREEKEDFLEKILPGETSILLASFIKVLVRKRRFQDFIQIHEEFERLYEAKLGIRRVRVETAVPLDEILQERLRQVLEKKMKRKVLLESEVKPEILGRAVIDFEGTRIDGSFRSALAELKQRLLPTSC
jgi:F-type H+-transporting ATPase subunit delta